MLSPVMQIDTSSTRASVKAVLGPTNTGKTHLAMERMLGFESGMIGFPLRLLARENYDRAVKAKGRRHVALITGEEKIIPPHARYFLCTVESMPVNRRFAFVGIDEIQMCADPDRGHIFTDRLLNCRGQHETMFMGAETIRPRIRQLVPEAEYISRPRFSSLTYTGPRKITRLPQRSAIVAFSASDVYAIAEIVRRQRGGAAVVLGALSPRTRNAQVAMYQAGEVDYLVATDAIGMGLNMDVDHVAFAATRKFDGRFLRDLNAQELAQIGGRAGRHMNDGTFGTTGETGPLDPETVSRIENHTFDTLKVLSWRNEKLRFSNLAALRQSLAQLPELPGLTRAREADDERVLSILLEDREITKLATSADAVRLLWDVCRVPDFRKMMADEHPALLGRIYGYLMGARGRIPNDWFAAQVDRLDRIDGDIETLMGRIAGIRTWTTVSFHGDWLDDAAHWQDRTRQVEDKLSDALHQSLTQRFVDRRTALLVKQIKERRDLVAAVNAQGEVLVEGHFVGSLNGFRFVADAASSSMGTAERAVTGAAMRALRGESLRRIQAMETDGDDAFAFSDGVSAPWDQVLWRDEPVARLVRGPDVLRPAVDPLTSDLLEGEDRERIRCRVSRWLEAAVSLVLRPLLHAGKVDLPGAARGLVFQLTESLGSMPRASAETQIQSLSQDDRRRIRKLGIRLGRQSVFMPALLKPAQADLRGLLWAVHAGVDSAPPFPPQGRVSVPARVQGLWPFFEACGFRPVGRIAIRIDMLERLAETAWELSRKGPFAAGPQLMSLAGCGPDDMPDILRACGYRALRNKKKLSGDAEGGAEGVGAAKVGTEE
ncbi:MAG: helicase-related protein, partial [Rhodospirillales bacterium]|nr:helicase-related protein [Rhodospirillales bacterium]